MALQIYSPSSSSFTTTNKPYHLHLYKPNKSNLSLIKSQNTPINNTEPTKESAAAAPKKPKPTSPGQGFGYGSTSSSSSNSGKSDVTSVSKKKKQPKSKRERVRASVVRRTPVEKLSVMSKEDEAEAQEMMKNESAFLLAWLGIGGIILFQGIALAASGFLPEKWDKLFVKYLYPTFTPTVGLFVAGTVGYGVLKYLQNEKINEQK